MEASWKRPDGRHSLPPAGFGAIMADRKLVSRTNISRSGAVRERVRVGKLQIDTAKRREARVDAPIKIAA